jgi:hypothetical protein
MEGTKAGGQTKRIGLPNRERAEAGLKKLDKTLRAKYGIKA